MELGLVPTAAVTLPAAPLGSLSASPGCLESSKQKRASAEGFSDLTRDAVELRAPPPEHGLTDVSQQASDQEEGRLEASATHPVTLAPAAVTPTPPSFNLDY